MFESGLCETDKKIFAQITLTLANHANTHTHAGLSPPNTFCDYVMSNPLTAKYYRGLIGQRDKSVKFSLEEKQLSHSEPNKQERRRQTEGLSHKDTSSMTVLP